LADAARFIIPADQLPEGDYVSPGLEIVRPDNCFPHMAPGDAASHPWPYLRREVGHAWYVDERSPLMGFVNRDEAILLYNIAKSFAGRRALEIGCWRGWSTCHLGLGGVSLDVLDPALADEAARGEIEAMVACAGLSGSVRLHAGASPEGVEELATAGAGPWSLFFIDGDHEGVAPGFDVDACLPNAAPDAAFVFHDLASPDVAGALRQLEARGFLVMLYQTMQIMGIAWRGRVEPVRHLPDPRIAWQLPHHLVGLPVSGVEFEGHGAALRRRLAEQARLIAGQEQAIAEKDAAIADLGEKLRRAGLRSRLRRLLGVER
jgi:predicted O-methyltransferase YrrM